MKPEASHLQLMEEGYPIFLDIPEGEEHWCKISKEPQRVVVYLLQPVESEIDTEWILSASCIEAGSEKQYRIFSSWQFQYSIEDIYRRALKWIEEHAEVRKKKQAPSYAFGSTHHPGLAKLVEECGEVIQVVGKIQGIGGMKDHWDGSNLQERLQEEIGDVYAALEFVVKHNKLDADFISQRQAEKLKLFEQWHKEQG